MSETVERRRSITVMGAVGLIYLAAYLLLDSTTRTFQTLPGVSPWYPPNALSLALLLVLGLRFTPIVFLASVLSNTLIWNLAVTPAQIVVLAGIPSLGYAGTAYIMLRVLKIDPHLGSPREAVLFIVVVLSAPVLIAGGEAYQSVQARIIGPSQLLQAFEQYWVGDIVGLLTLAPFLTVALIPWLRSLLTKAALNQAPDLDLQSSRRFRRLIEVAGISGATLIIGWVVLDLELLGSPPLVYPLFLPLIWSAMRYGMTGAVAASLGVGVTSMLFITAPSGSALDVSELQLFISLLSATGLVLGSLVSQERRAEQALSESEEQYHRVFESSSDCFIVLDRHRRIVDFNPAASGLFGYSPDELALIDPSSLIGDSYRPHFQEYLARALGGESLHLKLQGLRSSGDLFEASVATTHMSVGGVVHVLVLVRDITQEVRMLELLEERVNQRTQELSALLRASSAVAEFPELERSMPGLLDALNTTVDLSSLEIYLATSDGLKLFLTYGPQGIHWLNQLLSPQDRHRLIAETGFTTPLGGDPVPESTMNDAGLGQSTASRISVQASNVDALLVASNQALGIMRVQLVAARPPGEGASELIGAFADQISLAIQNAGLLQENRDRLREAESRRDVSESLAGIMRAVNSDLTISELMQVIVEQAAHVLDTDSVALYRLPPGEDALIIQASHALPEEISNSARLPRGFGAVGRAIQANEPVLLTNLRETLARDLEQLASEDVSTDFEWLFESFDTILSVPLQVRGETYGGISLYYRHRQELGPDQIGLAAAFSAQAALALENSRLAGQVRRLAALQERQRIARELHDSVSQALYGLTLGARTAHDLARSHGAELQEATEYVLELSETALKEMRTLIHELRPEPLRDQGLIEAIQRQAASLSERHGIEIRLEAPSDLAVDPGLEETLFRIVQESLQNAIRHPQPTHIRIRIWPADDVVQLEVQDDGSGFDPGMIEPGHFGLSTMRERAQQHSGNLRIDSSIGGGTVIRAVLPRRPGEPPFG